MTANADESRIEENTTGMRVPLIRPPNRERRKHNKKNLPPAPRPPAHWNATHHDRDGQVAEAQVVEHQDRTLVRKDAVMEQKPRHVKAALQVP